MKCQCSLKNYEPLYLVCENFFNIEVGCNIEKMVFNNQLQKIEIIKKKTIEV